MRVCIDLTSLYDNFSGIELYALNITKILIQNRSNDYILLFKNEVHSSFKNTQKNIQTIVLRGNNKLFFNQFSLLRKLYEIKADYYLFFAYTQPFFFFSKGIINTIHDLSCWDCPGSNKKHMILYWKVMFRRVAFGSGEILTVSRFSKERIEKILGVNPQRIHVTYSAPSNYVKDFKYDYALDFETKKIYKLPSKYILSLSTIEPRKNLGLLLKAYSELCDEGKIDCELVLAGRKGWMVENIISSYSANIRSKIHFTGFIDDKYLPYIYRNAFFFVFPSMYEGFGVPPIEALMSGTNVIASNAASIPEVLGEAALYFESGDLDSLKKRIIEMNKLSNVESENLRENAVNIVSKYNWENSARVVEVLIGKGCH